MRVLGGDNFEERILFFFTLVDIWDVLEDSWELEECGVRVSQAEESLVCEKVGLEDPKCTVAAKLVEDRSSTVKHMVLWHKEPPKAQDSSLRAVVWSYLFLAKRELCIFECGFSVISSCMVVGSVWLGL